MVAILKDMNKKSKVLKMQRSLSTRASYLDILLRHADLPSEEFKECLAELKEI